MDFDNIVGIFDKSSSSPDHFIIESCTIRDSDQKKRMEQPPAKRKIIFFGKLTEIAGEYISKGSSVYVEGSLKTEKWEDKEGNRKQVTKVIGSKLIMLGPTKGKKDEDAEFGPDGP